MLNTKRNHTKNFWFGNILKIAICIYVDTMQACNNDMSSLGFVASNLLSE